MNPDNLEENVRSLEEMKNVEQVMKRLLPDEYGETRLVLMVRDPEWIFSYWELSNKTRKEYGLEKGKHNKNLLIRLYDVTGINFNGKNARDFIDIEINDFTNNWYIKVPEPNQLYFAELGIIEGKGNFTQIVGSNIVKIPPKTLASVKEEIWARVSEEDFSKGNMHFFKQDHSAEKSEEIIKIGNKGSLHYKPSGSSK